MTRNAKLGGAAFATAFLALAFAASAAAQEGFQLLHEFTFGLDGAQPEGTLAVNLDGSVLYGTASGGGTANHGIVYRMERTPEGWHGTVLHDFAASNDGWYPEAGVIFDKAGNMYGTTDEGGPYGFGTVFELSPITGGAWSETILTYFSIDTDSSPQAPLTLDKRGNLYGTLSSGGVGSPWGAVFEMTPPSIPGGEWSFNVIYNFTNQGDGAYPSTGLLIDGQGNLYGTSYFGGINRDTGTVYELKRTSTGRQEETLYEFTSGDDGANPSGPLTADAKGDLYGVTEIAGSGECGVVYKLSYSKGTWSDSTLYSFDCGADGGHPFGNLTFDHAGNLYGTTKDGGGHGYGTVFKLSPNADGTWTEGVVYSFANGGDGANPQWGVALDTYGRMYGVTTYGGVPCGCGTMFELLPPTSTPTE